MELWDAYDRDFNKIEGVTLVRGEEASIPKGMYHLVCDILVRHKDGTYLLMQRDPRKTDPGKWEATAGGSALQGETPMQCGLRELREETGIAAEKLTELGRIVSPDTHSVYVEFFCETDCDKDSIVLQEGETSAYRWVDSDTIIHMRSEEVSTSRVQRYVEELQKKDMTVPCDNGLVSIRVGAIILREGRFLMVGNSHNNYVYSVGGRVKFGETADEAIVREVWEETGIRMEVDRLGFVHENYFYGDAPSNLGKPIYEISFFYYMKVPEDFEPVSSTFIDGGSEERLVWISPDDPIKAYPTFFKEELRHPEKVIKHLITDERR